MRYPLITHKYWSSEINTDFVSVLLESSGSMHLRFLREHHCANVNVSLRPQDVETLYSVLGQMLEHYKINKEVNE